MGPVGVPERAEGRISAEYMVEGDAQLTVCARNIGGLRCSPLFPATLGPRFCPPPPSPHEPCPEGLFFCEGSCRPYSYCSFER
jgi:hypothetical protein